MHAGLTARQAADEPSHSGAQHASPALWNVREQAGAGPDLKALGRDALGHVGALHQGRATMTQEVVRRMRFTLRARSLGSALVALLLISCGGKEGGAPIAPPPPTADVSAAVQKYLDDLIQIMREHSIHRRTIDWTAFRTSVFTAAAGAQSPSQTYEAIRVALTLLGDGHSIYFTPGGSVIFVPRRNCFAQAQATPEIPNDIGYVRVPGFAGGGAAATTFATGLQNSIRNSDRDGLAGWIVDLRGNGGGNMWPMLAGVGPVLGEGLVGHFIDPDGMVTTWEYWDGASLINTLPVVRVNPPYRLRTGNPRVAVLIDNGIASSGEATAIAFKARPDTRFFGTATCGLSTANVSYTLSDGAVLILTVSTMADRTKALYGDAVTPDEVFAAQDGVVDRAIEWLRSQ